MKHLAYLMGALMLCSWGFYAHKKINYLAVFSLPADMLPFYKENIQYLETHATDPDKRRYILENEAVRHYFDADHWGENPFDIFPLKWDSACAVYGKDSLSSYGILPWNLQWQYYSLVSALDSQDADRVLKLSADLGHYIGDASVPLHTTENYNGQLTNQHGIHALWESALPEKFFKEYQTLVGKAEYIGDKPAYFWKLIETSHAAVDSVLSLEKLLRTNVPANKQYTIAERNGRQISQNSPLFLKAYNKELDGMVERRFRVAIKAVADIWFSAWVDAGQPDMKLLNEKIDRSRLENLDAWLKEKKPLEGLAREHQH